MATFKCTGVGEIAVRFENMAKGTEAACKAAVKDGAAVLRNALSAAAPVDTGALSASIKAGSVQYDSGDGWHSEVKPVGTNHGENLAMIGNVLEYGRSNMAPRPWFAPTIKASEGEVIGAMIAGFSKAQNK